MTNNGLGSSGEYGVPRGLVFSFPVTVDEQGLCNVVQGLELTEVTKNHIKQLVKVNSAVFLLCFRVGVIG